MTPLGRQAIVIGGSIAGLMTARVLSDFFEQVVILERDEVEDRPSIHKSVPQGNHLHGLLQGGQKVLSFFSLASWRISINSEQPEPQLDVTSSGICLTARLTTRLAP